MTADAATNFEAPLTEKRLHNWHRLMFLGTEPDDIALARWRDDATGPMQVVSGGPMGRSPTVHFQAPPAHRVAEEMNRFLEWFNQPETEPDLRKPALAHLWFVTIHPYDDGNGRIARAITDLALARCDGTTMRFYSMSSAIMRMRSQYYQILEDTQVGSLDVTGWMTWFLDCLSDAIDHGETTAHAALSRGRLEELSEAHNLNHRQIRMVERLIDGWEGNLTPPRYCRMAKCSYQTAVRDLERLEELGILTRTQDTRRHAYRVSNLP